MKALLCWSLAAALSSATVAHAQTAADFECRNAIPGDDLPVLSTGDQGWGAIEDVWTRYEPVTIRPFGFQAESLVRKEYEDDADEEYELSLKATVLGDMPQVVLAAEAALGGSCVEDDDSPIYPVCILSSPSMEGRWLEVMGTEGGVILTCILDDEYI